MNFVVTVTHTITSQSSHLSSSITLCVVLPYHLFVLL